MTKSVELQEISLKICIFSLHGSQEAGLSNVPSQVPRLGLSGLYAMFFLFFFISLELCFDCEGVPDEFGVPGPKMFENRGLWL